jgi:glycosyltransferase 2 family protein
LSSARRHGLFALKLVVSLALIGYVLWGTDLAAIRAALADVAPVWLVFAFLLQLPGAALIAWRWSLLLDAKGVRPGFGYLFGSTMAASFFKQFMPSLIGGDAIRAYDSWRAGVDLGLSMVVLLIDRLLGLATLLSFALAAVAFGVGAVDGMPDVGAWALPLLALIAAMLASLTWWERAPAARLAGWRGRLPDPAQRKLASVGKALRSYRGRPDVLLRGLALSVLLQVNIVVYYWFVARSLGLDVPFEAFFLIVPIAIFVMMIPVSINGIGLREAVFVALLGYWSVPEPVAIAFAWLEFAGFLAFGLLGGVVYALRGRAAPAGERSPECDDGPDGARRESA